MTIGFKSRDVVELTVDPFGKHPSRTAVIISSAARPHDPESDEVIHTVTPMTSHVEKYADHEWAVFLDKSEDTVGQDLAYDSVVEPWVTMPISEDKINTNITQIPHRKMEAIAKAHARMILDEDV